MNVLFFCYEFPPVIGGIGRFSYSVSEWLADVDVNLTLLIPFRKKLHIKKARIKTFAIPKTRVLKILVTILALYKELIYSRYDIILLTDMRVLNIFGCLRLFLPSRYIPVFHGSEILDHLGTGAKRFIKVMYLRKLIQKSVVTVAVSEYVKNLMVRDLNVGADRIEVIHNGIDISAFCCKNPEFKKEIMKKYGLYNKKVIITVARLIKAKRHKLVIDTIARYRNSLKDVVYFIVGDGPERKNLEKLVEKRKLKDTVIFYGPIEINDARKACLYQMANLYIMPSSVETLGISFIEAAAVGVPSMGTNIGGISEIIMDNCTGFLVEDNEESIFEKLLFMIENPGKIEEMGKRARTVALEKLDRKAIVKKWIRIMTAKEIQDSAN